ncbi:hypothetical protein HK407_01g00030 [Ordospora pajunii]|uniref:uncharacterized protein n=1 Tax=Ordospora pajunii TaxID=3039483 RepID=UPI0029526985|nr:uncharacterized protein HK407_01g00030 [Ordospora pajunii]KAH9412112.1 hypothetical protein HK407_01g00030 [Ordospora pajunii]
MLLNFLVIFTIMFLYAFYSSVMKSNSQKLYGKHKKTRTYNDAHIFMLVHIMVTSGGMVPGPLTINRNIEVWINVIVVAMLMYSIVYCKIDKFSAEKFYLFIMTASMLGTSLLKIFSLLKYFIPSLQSEKWDKLDLKSDWPQISTFVFSFVISIIDFSAGKNLETTHLDHIL